MVGYLNRMEPAMPETKEKYVFAMKEALKALTLAISKDMTQFSTIEHSDLPGILRYFKEIRENLDTLDDLQKAVSSFTNKLSYETIPQAFEEEGVDSIKLAGRNFIVSSRLNASIPNDKKEVGFCWLTEHGLGAIIQPGVNPKTLSSAISRYLEEKGELPPPEAMSVYQQAYTSVRKA